MAPRSTALPVELQPSGVMPELATYVCTVPPGDVAWPRATVERVLGRISPSGPVTGDLRLPVLFASPHLRHRARRSA